jgi:hypothetical protein
VWLLLSACVQLNVIHIDTNSCCSNAFAKIPPKFLINDLTKNSKYPVYWIFLTQKNVLFYEMRKIRDEVEQHKNEAELQKKIARSMRDKVGEFDKVSSQLSNSERKYRLAMQDITQLKYVRVVLSAQICYLLCMPCMLCSTSPYIPSMPCMPCIPCANSLYLPCRPCMPCITSSY